MNTSDVLALLALVVSLASFGVAGFTFYQQFSRRADLQIDLGPSVRLAYGEDRTSLAATISVSLTNAGARDAVVTKIAGALANENGTWDVPVLWYAFFKPTDAGKPGETSAPWWSFDGWVTPIVVPSRQSTARAVAFNVAPIADSLRTDEYRLTLCFTIQGGKVPVEVWTASFALEDQRALEDTVGVGNVGPSVEATLSATQRSTEPSPTSAERARLLERRQLGYAGQGALWPRYARTVGLLRRERPDCCVS